MNRSTKDLLLTALAPVMWGTTYVVTTEFLPADRPFLTAMLRALPAGLLLIVLSRRLPRGSWWWRSAVIGTLNIAAFFALLFIATYRLPGGVAAVAAAVGPLATAGATLLILHQKVRLRTWLLGLTGVAGVAMVVLSAEAELDTLGAAAGIGGAVSMAVAVVLTKRWGIPKEAGPAALAGWQLTAGGLLLIPLAFAVEGAVPVLTGTNLLGYLYLGLVNTALGYWLWFRGIGRLSVVPLSFLGLLSPLTAATVGWIALGETFTPLQTAGFAVALAATVAAQLHARPKPPAVAVAPAPKTLVHS
ncbi:EamA family transporter [Glycomyces algeriensis]|uniref:ABC transporter permease n=1 Tax=Glycomyces algeriensis TaxID=256037 RepID=A0A9W6G8X2_9ACTN|nr:EamA family transporter [Glycomyces algeriensis]MDA1365223.1 EamA family transporter [Glycomyces algeriensis]MDR7349713.1 putative blue pigment (indigoidine) exporter [Glycomyces algeriensis]GLI42423.1 ABC transporter permease [Glycomyces algeriensis]